MGRSGSRNGAEREPDPLPPPDPVSARGSRVEGEPDPSPVFLTPYELSRRWAWTVRERTLRNWRADGRGPRFVKPTTVTVLYRVCDVEAYEAACEGRIYEGKKMPAGAS